MKSKQAITGDTVSQQLHVSGHVRPGGLLIRSGFSYESEVEAMNTKFCGFWLLIGQLT